MICVHFPARLSCKGEGCEIGSLPPFDYTQFSYCPNELRVTPNILLKVLAGDPDGLGHELEGKRITDLGGSCPCRDHLHRCTYVPL